MDLKSESSGVERNVFVLSGGAARGAVQVGMMEVLLEHGIVPDALVGTSVGALNAAFMGCRPDRTRIRELRAQWLQLSTQDIFPGGTLTRVGHLLRQRPYLFSSCALTRLIADWLPARNLEDLPTPVRIVTTPLAGDSAVYHRHGSLEQLLLASAAVPAVFAPVHLPEQLRTSRTPRRWRRLGPDPDQRCRRPGAHPGLRPRCQRPGRASPRADSDRRARRQPRRVHAGPPRARPGARCLGPPDDHP